jgi:uncharacterized protein involved in exopolysaccharide biosynthesis
MKETRDIIRNPLTEPVDLERPFDPQMPTQGRYPSYRNAEVSDGFQLVDYWRAIRKRLWLVIGIAVLITTLTAIYMARRPNIYSARAVVQVDLEQTNPDLQVDRQRPISNPDPSYFNTQLQLLWSDGLLRRVIKEHNLDENKDFQQAKTDLATSPLRSILRSVGLATEDRNRAADKALLETTSGENPLATSEEIADAVRLAPFVDVIHRNLQIDPVRESRATVKDTRLIQIAYQHSNPDLAAFVVNAIGETFTQVNQEKRSGTSRKTNDFLQERIADLQTNISNDEQKLVDLTKSLGSLMTSGEQAIVVERLAG